MTKVRNALIASVALALCACAGSALTVAQTVQQRAYVVERSYNIVLEDSLAVARSPTTSAQVRMSIQRASATASPIIDQLDKAMADAAVERAKFNANQSTIDKVELAANNLQGWIDKAEKAMVGLRSAF